MSDVKQPATPTPKRNILEGLRMLERTGEGNYLTQAYPKLSGFLESALMGTAPDQLGGSVLDPQTAQRRAGAEYGFPVGLAAMLAPAVGPLTKLGRGIAEAPSMVAGSRAAQRGVIKAPGGNWLSGSVEDALKGLKRDVPLTADEMRRAGSYESEIERALANPPPTNPLNQFVDKQLTRYVKNDMATPNDPIRALAERGVLHIAPHELLSGATTGSKLERKAMGFPVEGNASSDLAKRWENSTDNSVLPMSPARLKGYFGSDSPRVEANNSWLSKLNPNDKVYAASPSLTEGEDLGFRHLMDELRNATNINSGLPAHLRLDPESLARVSVPQAVERVAKINDWRAAQKVAADQARANNAATALHKDYPDKGFKWVELKAPAPPATVGELPDALKYQAIQHMEYGNLSEEAAILRAVREDRNTNALRDALKYEGDTMGHCVGSYCDDVASGKSRIFSLRDAKGQPHTTIELGKKTSSSLDDIRRWRAQAKEELKTGPLDPQTSAYATAVNNRIHELQTSQPESIIQIKGKGNKAPNPEYLPYVQDFVKSGKWSDVGDLQNTGLINFRGGKTNIREGGQTYGTNLDMPKGYMTKREASQFLEAQGVPTIQARRHVGDFEGLLDIKPPGYADGGSVRAMVNAAVGSSNLAKQVGNSADAVRSIAAGTGSMGDLNSLRQMAASMGYTSPGLSQAMGLAGAAKAGYNAMTDPSARNLAGFASSVNPLAAKAISIYNAVTDPEPAGFVDALASFNPLTSAWNTLARAADFATLGQVVRNVNKISDPNAPAELRDMLSNNPNSASLTRNANDLSALTGRDSLDTMMDMTGAFGTIPGVPSYYSGASGSSTGTTSAPNGGGSFPSYSGGDGVNGHSDAGGYGGYGGGF